MNQALTGDQQRQIVKEAPALHALVSETQAKLRNMSSLQNQMFRQIIAQREIDDLTTKLTAELRRNLWIEEHQPKQGAKIYLVTRRCTNGSGSTGYTQCLNINNGFWDDFDKDLSPEWVKRHGFLDVQSANTGRETYIQGQLP